MKPLNCRVLKSYTSHTKACVCDKFAVYVDCMYNVNKEVLWACVFSYTSDPDKCKEKGWFTSEWIANMIIVSSYQMLRNLGSQWGQQSKPLIIIILNILQSSEEQKLLSKWFLTTCYLKICCW